MLTNRLAHVVGVLLTVAALGLIGGAPAGAEPVRGPECPQTRAQLAGQHITSVEELPDLTCADLHGAVLDGLDLAQENLSGVDAHGASFRGTDLTQATLTGADLRGARFDGADLTQAQLNTVDARDATFTEARLSQVDLAKADLRGADFTGASLTQADLTGADLRGARTVFAEAIQADTKDAKVDVLDPRTFQASLLAVLVGLGLLVRSLFNVARGLTPGGSSLKRGLVRLAVYAVVSVLVWLPAGMMLPLMFVAVLYPWLVGALFVYLSGAVRGWRPERHNLTSVNAGTPRVAGA
ncbi:pentapeptide repeat-containing protein [Dactylosporangium sp. NPDC005555]|uniref:pentapeptide repeat-containing protein n=1 Tax=Dactylosporangium sp. NPDC005555 TaxID=3154889 RepID=UPI0033AAC448